MFRIGEFSRLTQISIRMLRYYDETGLLKPVKTDPFTGYRMYSAEQIKTLNKIVYLRDSGFLVPEIAAILKDESKDRMMEQLDNKYTEILKQIQAEKEKLEKIELAKKEIIHGRDKMHYQITLKNVPAYQVLSLRRKIPDYYGEGDLWQELAKAAEKHHIAVSGEAFSIYHDLEYKESDVEVELCALVKKAGKAPKGFQFRVTEPVPVMAATMVYGEFSNIAGVYLSFAGWLEKNSRYRMGGQSRQIVHRGPWNEENPEKYLTEIQIPLEHNLLP